ncbi:MAG: DUF2520 domain-containing protein, partial [Gloeobacteraceae cyanobacterium ES-bin-316]|nr:DUF2520 domain-containing protein [Ferruginibacter sp.]
MRISLIGSGNVASVLGRVITGNNHEVIQVISRDADNAKLLAEELGASYSDFSGQPDVNADLFILAIADQALEHFFTSYGMGNKMVVHTAGSVSIDLLSKYSTNYGVLYPLQSLRKEMQLIPRIPFLVDSNTTEGLKFIEDFAQTISDSVRRVGDEERLKLHAAAVIVSNFTNHLYSIAEDFCEKENLDFNMLKPLILETAYRVQNASPSKVQTGPAVRKDILTMDKHLRVFTAHPKLRTT